VNPQEVARALGVQTILTGRVEQRGDDLVVSAELMDARDGTQVWGEQYSRKAEGIQALQEEIAHTISEKLRLRLTGAQERQLTKHATQSSQAYQLYMKGRYHALKLTRAETDKGINYFQQAIEIDPNYALAYSGLARAYLPMALTSGVPSWEVMPKAKAAALRAVEIDETLAEGYATLGLIMFWYDWDWQASEKQYLRALKLNSNSSEGRFSYAHLLSNTGRHEQALAEIKLSRELDPLSLVTNALEGQILFFGGKYDEALDRLQKTIDLEPNFWLSHLFISRVYGEKGMHAEAIAAAQKAGELSGNSQSNAFRAYALAKAGKTDEARAVLDELLKLSVEQYVPPYNFAIIYYALGQPDRALDYLEKGYEQKDVRMVFLKVEPKWNNLRSEPRFLDLMKRMRLE
jgi:tetratricopeptide (TPR) repeat protein